MTGETTTVVGTIIGVIAKGKKGTDLFFRTIFSYSWSEYQGPIWIDFDIPNKICTTVRRKKSDLCLWMKTDAPIDNGGSWPHSLDNIKVHGGFRRIKNRVL